MSPSRPGPLPSDPNSVRHSRPPASCDLTRAGFSWSQKVSEAAGGSGLGLRVLLGAAWRDLWGWGARVALGCSPTRLPTARVWSGVCTTRTCGQ